MAGADLWPVLSPGAVEEACGRRGLSTGHPRSRRVGKKPLLGGSKGDNWGCGSRHQPGTQQDSKTAWTRASRERQLLSQVADSSPLRRPQALGKTPCPPSSQGSGRSSCSTPLGPKPTCQTPPRPPVSRRHTGWRKGRLEAEASRQTQAQGPGPGDSPGGFVPSNVEVEVGPHPGGSQKSRGGSLGT